MLSTSERTNQYRDLIDVKWQRGIEQIILKYNNYIDCSNLIKYRSIKCKRYMTLNINYAMKFNINGSWMHVNSYAPINDLPTSLSILRFNHGAKLISIGANS